MPEREPGATPPPARVSGRVLRQRVTRDLSRATAPGDFAGASGVKTCLLVLNADARENTADQKPVKRRMADACRSFIETRISTATVKMPFTNLSASS